MLNLVQCLMLLTGLFGRKATCHAEHVFRLSAESKEVLVIQNFHNIPTSEINFISKIS
jgi:hypothetical protein